ncbi:MAG: hypothetical protein ACLVC1_05170 [Mediterraneibacter gnavus]
MSTLYMYGCGSENCCKICVVFWRSRRVEVVKQYLENPKKVAFMREFNTHTGTYKGIEVTADIDRSLGAPALLRSPWKKCMRQEWKWL